MRLFALQLLDCTTSRRQIQPELMVERVLVRDRLEDIILSSRPAGAVNFSSNSWLALSVVKADMALVSVAILAQGFAGDDRGECNY